MKKSPNESEKILAGLFAELGSAEPLPEHVKDVGERVLERFQAATLAVWEPATLAPDEIRLSRRPWKGFFAFAAIALTFAVALSAALWRNSDTSGVARLQDGAIYEAGETFRAINNGSTVITLADGSRVEMRSGGKASVDRASDGLVFHLKSGSIIVNAAKQSAGRHLYVQTNDVTVSVVGTVFFVNAEAEGSRVAVIEGEVHVQQGAMEKRLLPGQQVATSPRMEASSVGEEISWSRSADTHLALLQQSTEVSSGVAKKRLEFEAASIKLSPPANGPIGSASPECRGIDGLIGEGTAIPLGRCVGDHVSLRWLVVAAYGLSSIEGRVEGLPDWGDQPRRNGYQIEAKAADPATTTKEHLRQMLQVLLADRFKLKLSQEKREVQGFILSALNNGKLATASTEEPFRMRRSEVPGDNTQMIISGKGSMEAFSEALSDILIYGPVLDKTELGGMYDFNVTATYPTGRAQPGPGGQRGTGIGGGPETSNMVSAVRSALQSQLGLKLEIGKVPEAFVVIEHVERLSEN